MGSIVGKGNGWGTLFLNFREGGRGKKDPKKSPTTEGEKGGGKFGDRFGIKVCV